MIKFQWNETKSKANLKKHGVSFSEARTVFFDEHAIQFFDSENSHEEDRFLMLGLSCDLNLLLVCHCEREGGQVIRIISARKATKSESRFYIGNVP